MTADETTPEPGRRPGGRTARVRRRILEAAAELIARDGFGGLHYGQVAELAGVNKASVYRNWPDRTTLLADALASFSTHAAPLHDSGDVDADLVDFLEALAAALSSPQGRALLNVVGSAHDNPGLRAVVDEAFAQRLGRLRQRVDAAIENGELPVVDCHLLVEMLSGPVHGLVSRGAREFTRADAQQITAIVLAGVRATAAPDGTPDAAKFEERPDTDRETRPIYG
ncbi:TetR family transcriptional regulator [Streptomyces tauricus]|uniref:TetR/AcrR family transcriptional regulator n=1 Tax=Streptomyces tauricus TaxID=68274 RepID=UPI00167B5F3B|nr:TetR/AcrR family transcriptional regulator C-terminal ligand-binding domain-containing protein [Streptomyces tauricus]GHA65971.1 TetR family transcriptional regulator [Streptomyces tauricus]